MERENLTESEFKGFKLIVSATLELSEIQIDELMGKGELIEVICNETAWNPSHKKALTVSAFLCDI